jgi:hypothetical protein
MTLGDLEKRIKEIKACLIEDFDWTEEDLANVPVAVCLEDEEMGFGTVLKDVSVDAPPVKMYLTGQIAKGRRIIVEDIDETEKK